MQEIINAEKSDLFDVLAYVAYTRAPVTRQERASKARPAITARFNEKQQAFLDFVLAQYVLVGESELDPDKLPELLQLKYGSPGDAVRELGSVAEIRATFHGFQRGLYDAIASPDSVGGKNYEG